ARFLEHESPARAGVRKLVINDALGRGVRTAHEIGRPLAADLKLLDLAKVAAQARTRLARGALHHADQSRKCHSTSLKLQIVREPACMSGTPSRPSSPFFRTGFGRACSNAASPASGRPRR